MVVENYLYSYKTLRFIAVLNLDVLESSIIQKTSNTNVVEVMEKTKVIVEKRGEIVIDEEGDDDVVLLENTSKFNIPNCNN